VDDTIIINIIPPPFRGYKHLYPPEIGAFPPSFLGSK
jgi:hypothetical protein